MNIDREIKDRLTTLEVQSEERWKAHNEKSEERRKVYDKRNEEHWKAYDEKSDIVWGEIRKDIKAIFSKFDILVPKKDVCMKEAREHTSKVVGLALGIPTFLFVLFKIGEAMFK